MAHGSAETREGGDAATRVLWLDNDPFFIRPWIDALKKAGHWVEVARSLSEGERQLSGEQWDLLLLDVMIQTRTAEEQRRYGPEETDRGREAGLVFFQRHRNLLESRGIPVIVLTNRLDHEIQQKFQAAGLPDGSFFPLVSVRVPSELVKVVGKAITAKPEISAEDDAG